MSRLILVGDSNLYRNITVSKLSKKINQSPLILHATRQQTLEVSLASVTPECEILLVSSLANILCDEFGQDPPSDKSLIASVTKFVDLVSSAPSAITLVAPPIFRSVPKWFGEYTPKLRLALVDAAAKYKHVTILPSFTVCQIDLLQDGVHLGTDTGAKFLDYVASCIQDVSSIQSHSEKEKTPPPITETIEDVTKLIRTEVLPLLADSSKTTQKVSMLNENSLAFMSIIRSVNHL